MDANTEQLAEAAPATRRKTPHEHQLPTDEGFIRVHSRFYDNFPVNRRTCLNRNDADGNGEHTRPARPQ
jgi:hypothetical protein